MSNEIELLRIELAHLRERVADGKQHDRELVTTKYEADQANIRQIITDLERQLEQLSAQRDQVVDKFNIQLNALSEKTDATIRPLAEQLSKAGKPDWTLLIGLASVFLVIVSGIYFLISQQIAVSSAPITLAVERLKADSITNDARLRTVEVATVASASADVESKVDRSRLNTSVNELGSKLFTLDASRREAEARQAATNVEIETQFCAADSFRNLTHASDLRVISMVWAKTHPGETYPTDNAYYPIICNRTAR